MEMEARVRRGVEGGGGAPRGEERLVRGRWSEEDVEEESGWEDAVRWWGGANRSIQGKKVSPRTAG